MPGPVDPYPTNPAFQALAESAKLRAQLSALFGYFGQIKNADLDAAAAIVGSKIADAAITAAKIADGAVTVGKEGPRPTALAYHAIDTAIGHNNFTPLVFNQERFDADSIHDTATNTGRLTCKTAGVYLVTANISWAANPTGARVVSIRKNGTLSVAADERVAVTEAFHSTSHCCSKLLRLAVNDYLEVIVHQMSGGNLNVSYSDGVSPEFGMTWVAP